MGDIYQLRGPKGERLTLSRQGEVLSLGRRSSNDMVLSDDSVSRNHALIRFEGERVVVRDNGSREGSFIDGKRMGGGQWYPLKPGAVLLLGRYPLLLEKTQQATPAPLSAPTSIDLSGLSACACSTALDDKASYLALVASATRVMAATSGVVELSPGPTLVIPDLHGQREYLLRALKTRSSFSLLERGELNVLCLGDGLHGERRVRERWLQAERDYQSSGRPCAAIEQEAVESLGLMKMVLHLKSAFPTHFHYLRGNHDEINNPLRKIYKYTRVGESELFREFLQRRFGLDFLEQWAAMEATMPLMAVGRGFVASHAAPGAALTRQEIKSRSPKAFTALAWTNNCDWREGGPHRDILRKNLDVLRAPQDSHWIAGHCKVETGLFRSQLGGQLIQVNPRDPSTYVVALIPAEGRFLPERDVFAI